MPRIDAHGHLIPEAYRAELAKRGVTLSQLAA